MNAYFVLTSLLPFLISADAQCKCSDLQWIFNSSNTIEHDRITTTETIFTSKPEQIITNYRLPTSLIPIHYDLELKPSFNHPNFIFDGKVAIWFKCTQATDQIILHSRSLYINTITVSSDDYYERNITITNFIHDISQDFLIIDLKKYLKEGEEYTILISFSGVLSEYNGTGFVLSYYNARKDGRNSRRYLAVTHFEPFSARSAFPCFDEPQLKATFNISIVRLSNMTAISNMPLLRSRKQDLWIVDDFKKSPKMSTYLVAAVVSDLAYVEVQAGNTIVRIWIRPGLENSTKLISSAVPIILKYMEEYTEIPYVLPKLDIISVPKSRPGAMENWGLIRFNEKYMLYNATLDTNPSVVTYLIHEIAHQWFGNLITMKWWNDLWLKEGLSTYITSLICPLIKNNPDKQSCLPSSLNSASNFFRIMYFEMDSRSHALSPNPNLLSADEIESMFSPISYQKGAIIIRMMELFAGKEVLRKGLLKYLLANMYGNADRYNLYQHISQELNVSGIEDLNVKEIMDTWVLQQGIPIVTVTRNYLSNTAFVRQKVFQEKNSEVNFNKDNRWAIPLTFTTKHLNIFDVKSCKWMHNEEFVQLTTDDGLPTKDEWVLFNPSLHGYYIVNYDNRNWKLLINQLIEDNRKFPLEVRLHLFQTLDVLKRNNLVPHHVTDYMFEYIRNEQNQYILIMGLREILNLFYIFKPTLHFHLFRKYLLHVLTPIWNHFKLTETTEKYHEEFKVLLYQLACRAGVKECVEEIIRRMHDSIDAKTFTKYVDEITVCSAMSEMPKEKWEEFWSLRNKIPKTVATYSHKINIQNLFSCTENPYLILKVLNTVLDQISINRHQSTSVFMSAIDNHYFSRQLAFKVFNENLQKFLDWFEIKPILNEFFCTATTQHDIDEVKSIISCIPQSFIKGDENSYRKMIIKSQKQFEIRKNIISVNYNWLELVTQKFFL